MLTDVMVKNFFIWTLSNSSDVRNGTEWSLSIETISRIKKDFQEERGNVW